jgi:hypothetical protein
VKKGDMIPPPKERKVAKDAQEIEKVSATFSLNEEESLKFNTDGVSLIPRSSLLFRPSMLYLIPSLCSLLEKTVPPMLSQLWLPFSPDVAPFELNRLLDFQFLPHGSALPPSFS